MIRVELENEIDFDGWRDAARALALNEIPSPDVVWQVAGRLGDDLFASDARPVPPAPEGATLNVSREFVERVRVAICHSDPERFAFLYRLLLRVSRDKKLLSASSDEDVRRLEEMEKSVRRDVHKMRAFVRFRKIGEGDGERFVAWFEPDHHIVERNAEFFVKRFTGMHWTILSPEASLVWDGETLKVGPGAKKSDLPAEDAAEDLWKTYFSSIFNPARLKVKAMTAEMPKKYWKNMPEAALIPGMISGAGRAAQDMLEKAPTMPAKSHAAVRARHWQEDQAMAGDGDDAKTLEQLRAAASACTRCPLHADATQTVFGEGPPNAPLVFVGEQPGDQEDIQGRPFVGPAGQLFDEILGEVGIDRSQTYVTNAVKHFKFEPRGKRRIHMKPDAGEVRACRWWVEKEITLTRPKLVVALGATAMLSMLDRSAGIMKARGTIETRPGDGLPVLLTYHPSFLLRIRDGADKARERANFTSDLAKAKAYLAA